MARGQATSATTIREVALFLAAMALAAWLLRSLVVAPFSIPSGSMMPTMLPGDYLFVKKWPYGYSRFSFPAEIPRFAGRSAGAAPRRGDVVVFKRPDGSGEAWVKRVIGLPGDRVEVRGGAVLLNGRALERRALAPVAIPIGPNTPCHPIPGRVTIARGIDGSASCRYRAFRETIDRRAYVILDPLDSGPGDTMAAVRVPSGMLFLMGDNRDSSADSRIAPAAGGLGLVPVENLLGPAAVAFWSSDGSASIAAPWRWPGALRSERLGLGFQP